MCGRMSKIKIKETKKNPTAIGASGGIKIGTIEQLAREEENAPRSMRPMAN